MNGIGADLILAIPLCVVGVFLYFARQNFLQNKKDTPPDKYIKTKW